MLPRSASSIDVSRRQPILTPAPALRWFRRATPTSRANLFNRLPYNGGRARHQPQWNGRLLKKLNAAGSALAISTYLGGGDDDIGTALRWIRRAPPYVTGSRTYRRPRISPSTDVFGPGPGIDAFVAKINPNVSGAASLVYLARLGGTLNDVGNGIAVNSLGNASYRTSDSSEFPTSGSTAFDAENLAGEYAFVSNFDPTGASLVFSTYLGIIHDDEGWGIAVDAAGSAYVTGMD